MRIAKEFPDGTALGWDRGVIDSWCVYYRDENGTVSAPTDVEYFTELLGIADTYGHQRVYADFVSLYDSVVSKDPAECHIEVIDRVVSTYPVEDRLSIDKNFTTLWMAMVSEWNYMIYGRIPTKLQHRIKRLGVFTMLIKG